MNLNKVKYALIAVPILFVLAFSTLVALVIIYPHLEKQKILREQRINEAERFKIKADSIAHVVELTQDSINEEIKQDSVRFIQQKESLKSVYIKKVKAYESRLADIDTMDIQLNGSFSIREMLSDSASKVW